MFCPKCKCEYREGFTICADCHVELVKNLPETSEPETEVPFDGNIEACNPVKLTTVSNELDAQLVLNLLRNNNIPCFRKNKEAGGYMNIYMGYSVFGEDIYVAERDYSTAIDLLSVMQPEDEQSHEDDQSYYDSNTDYHVPFYRNRNFFVNILRAVLISYVILNIVIFIVNILNR